VAGFAPVGALPVASVPAAAGATSLAVIAQYYYTQEAEAMAIKLRQSTASQEIPLGTFVSTADGFTTMTALSIANTDIKLWFNGATTLASKNSGGATHIAGGNYYCVLDATDTATLGPMKVTVNMAGALPLSVMCEVQAANVYDSLVGGSDALQIDAIQFAGQTITAAAGVTLPSSVASPTNITAGTITTVSGNVTGSVGSVVGLTASNLDTTISSRMATYTQPTGFLAATFPSDPADASDIAAATAAIQSDTNDIQSRLPAALVDGKMDSTNSDTVIVGTVGSASTTTSIVTSAFSPAGATADQFKGRILIFDNDTATPELRGQASSVDASSGASTPILTVIALTTAPSSGDTFHIT
jgi:hypothetical protein